MKERKWNRRFVRHVVLGIAVAFTSAACAHRSASPGSSALESASAVASPRGNLLIVGGGPTPSEITRRFVELAGGPGKANIAVLPMASGVATTGPNKVAELQSLGADAFVMNIARGDADADSIVSKLASATGIWFPGGDQNRITAALGGTRAAQAIRDRYVAGAVVGGTSAGAAIMSTVMLTGDERRLGGDRPPADSSQAYITIDRNNIVTVDGLGLIQGAIVDQHFVRRRRLNRLISVVLEHQAMIGAGVDESTALEVRPDGTWEVIGASVVVIFDARAASVTRPGSPLGASGVQMHVLPSGSRFDPRSGKVTRLGKLD